MFMESWILRVSCKINVRKGLTLALQETWSIHDSMNIPKIDFISYIKGLHCLYHFKYFLTQKYLYLGRQTCFRQRRIYFMLTDLK